MSRGANAPREFLFDVLVAGEPARRQVPVACSPSGLRFDGEQVEMDSIFWVSRRAGLILLFARRRTLVFFGDGGDLQELARAPRTRDERGHPAVDP